MVAELFLAIAFNVSLPIGNCNPCCNNRHWMVTILQINQVAWFSVRAAEAKLNFPTRHDWDSWFRDAKNMNEMKPGERPDTVHFKDLPSRWFANKRDKDKDSPSKYLIEYLFNTTFERVISVRYLIYFYCVSSNRWRKRNRQKGIQNLFFAHTSCQKNEMINWCGYTIICRLFHCLCYLRWVHLEESFGDVRRDPMCGHSDVRSVQAGNGRWHHTELFHIHSGSYLWSVCSVQGMVCALTRFAWVTFTVRENKGEINLQ